MQSTVYDPSTLQSLLKLAKKRKGIIKTLQQIEGQIAELVQCRSEAGERLPLPLGRTMGRGMLKQQILFNLSQAGEKGMTVRELSLKLGIPNQNIHVWFSSTGKRVSGLSKIGEAHYSYAPKTASLPDLPTDILRKNDETLGVNHP